MATITTLAGGTGIGTAAKRVPYVQEVTVDFAEAAAANGGSLAAADVIEALEFSAGTLVLAAGMEAEVLSTTGSADTGLTVGMAGTDFATGFVYGAAAVGDASVGLDVAPLTVSAADTMDVTIATATTAPTDGKVRVWALVVDISDVAEANEVVRDQLA